MSEPKDGGEKKLSELYHQVIFNVNKKKKKKEIIAFLTQSFY